MKKVFAILVLIVLTGCNRKQQSQQQLTGPPLQISKQVTASPVAAKSTTAASRLDFAKNWFSSESTKKWADQGILVGIGGEENDLLVVYFSTHNAEIAAQMMSPNASSEFSKFVSHEGFKNVLGVRLLPGQKPGPSFTEDQIAYTGTVSEDGVGWNTKQAHEIVPDGSGETSAQSGSTAMTAPASTTDNADSKHKMTLEEHNAAANFIVAAQREMSYMKKGEAFWPLNVSSKRNVTPSGWIPLITIENTSTNDLERIYLEFQVYDHNSLVWSGNTMVDSLKGGTSYTTEASYDPSHHYVPNSVRGKILLTKKEWYKNGEYYHEDERQLDEDNRLHGQK